MAKTPKPQPSKSKVVADPTATTQVYVEHKHPDYITQENVWTKMEDLFLGEERVKEKATVYLPATEIESAEKDLSKPSSRYFFRLQNSPFFNGVGRLTRCTMGQLYRNCPKFTVDVPEKLKPMMKNVDMMGTPFDVFAKNVSSWSYAIGHYFVLVDMPDASGITNKLQQEQAKLYPYFVMVHPNEIINWKATKSTDGKIVLDWIVRKETSYESDNPNEPHKKVTRFRVWYRDKWELYEVSSEENEKPSDRSKRNLPNPRSNSDTETTARLVQSGKNPLGVVPLVPIYSQMVRPMVSQPPLEESGNLNLHHYKLFSAFNNGLMYHLSPILHISGVTNVEQIKIGAKAAIITPRNGEVKYAEYQGNGLKIAKDTADGLAQEMWDAGMRTNTNIGVNTSGKAIHSSRADFIAWMTAIAISHETGWSEAFKIAAKWAKVDLTEKDPETPILKMNRDFDLSLLEANSAEFLLNARKAGEISRKTFLTALKRGEVLTDDLDVDQEIKDSKSDLKFDMEILAEIQSMGEPSQPNPPKDKSGSTTS